VTDAQTPAGSDARALAEAVVDVLEERGLLPRAVEKPGQVLNVGDVALLLGRSRAWVYAHAAELGAFKYASGPKARIGFDRDAIERWKSERQILRSHPPEPSPRRRRRRQNAAPTRSNLIPYDRMPFRA
jgi:predicted DNA-binding transcriptional regulator AlpA